MNISSSGILSLYSDPFIKKCIETYLSKTEYATTSNYSFNQLINEIFINIDRKTLIEAFKSYDNNNIDDMLWLKAGTSLINDKEYITYSNVGSQYYKSILIEFVGKNKALLINEFIIKFCKEKEIRQSIIKKVLITQNLENEVIGTILGKAYKEEIELSKEEREGNEVIFTVHSKEEIQYELPVLTNGWYYYLKIEEGDGVGYVNNNIINYIPPVVPEKSIVHIQLAILNNDGIVESRNYYKIVILPQKYLKPIFNTYKMKPNTTIQVPLEPVEEGYSYNASVLNGFGAVELDGYTLNYTSPITSINQNVAVRLSLVWNHRNTLYDTVINFNILVSDEDVDITDSTTSMDVLNNKLKELDNKLSEVDSKVNNVNEVVDKINIIKNPNEFDDSVGNK